MKIKNILANCLGVFFLVYGLVLACFFNFHAGSVLTLAMGASFIFIGSFWSKVSDTLIFKFLKTGVCLFIGFMVAMVSFTFVSKSPVETEFDEDVVIVLGTGIRGEEITNSLKLRLDACLEYIEKNPKALIVVSGGQGPLEDITEALAMERYLTENGVDAEKIIQEGRSSSTYENFVYSKEILDNRFREPYKTVFITNNFHCYRAYNLSKNAGIETSCYPAKDEFLTAIPSYFRESLAIIKLWIFGI